MSRVISLPPIKQHKKPECCCCLKVPNPLKSSLNQNTDRGFVRKSLDFQSLERQREKKYS